MRKVSANAAAAAAIVATRRTQQVVPENGLNRIENNNTILLPTKIVVDSSTLQNLLIQNRVLHNQNVEITSTMKKQHDYMKFELQQIKQFMQQLVHTNQQLLTGQTTAVGASFPTFQIQEQPVLDNDDNQADTDDDDDDDGSHRSNNTIIDHHTTPYESTLSKYPKDLFQLWREYQYGIDGRKPAKKFTSSERGKVRFLYHRRKIVWDKIIEMKIQYKTSRIAIEELYRRYGGKDKTVTQITNQIKRDRKTTPPPVSAAAGQHTTVVGDGGPLVQQQQPPPPVRANDGYDSYLSDDTTIIDDGTIPFETTLSKQPKDLYQLWEEFQYGIGGRKPAKKFTTKERGKVRFLYTRRKVFWDKMKELLKYEGHTYHTAIEELYGIYGKLPVTAIINQMRKDRGPKKNIIKKHNITGRV